MARGGKVEAIAGREGVKIKDMGDEARQMPL